MPFPPFNSNFLDSNTYQGTYGHFFINDQNELLHDTGGKLTSLTSHIYHVDVNDHLNTHINKNMTLRHTSLTISNVLKVKISFISN